MARLAFECYLSITIDKIEPVRPGCVSGLRLIIYGIDQRREFYAQICRARASYTYAIVIVLRVVIDYLLLLVDFHLPPVAGMRFLNVDEVELYLVSILLVEPVESGNLPPKWRSGVTAEN
jgi:hypothetical protein